MLGLGTLLSYVTTDTLLFGLAPRANWKGFLRLSLVTCPVALYPATSDSEKISFNQINRKTGRVNCGSVASSSKLLREG